MNERPNILWIMTDEQRTDSLGYSGSTWARTPTFDRLADQGVVFAAAVTPAPVCVPARSSLLTGRYPNESGIWSNDSAMERQLPPLTAEFAAAGYATATFGKQHHLTDANQAFETEVDLVLTDEVGYFGYDDRWDRDDYDIVQYTLPERRWVLAGRFPGDAEETSEARVVAQAQSWLDTLRADEPFLLRISFNGPHTPVVPPAPYDTVIDPADVMLPGADDLPDGAPAWLRELAEKVSSSRLTGEQIDRSRQAYYGEVSFLDTLVERMLDGMRERGLLENLIVCFTTDHGTHLGDFGLVQKQTLFEPVVTVPFLFWGPGVVESRDPVAVPVETRSLLPTLLELAGIPCPTADEVAPSLAATLTTGVEPPLRPVFSEFADAFGFRRRILMVREGDWKLSLTLDDGPGEFFLVDLSKDPREAVNRADDPEAQPVLRRLVDLAVAHVAAPPGKVAKRW